MKGNTIKLKQSVGGTIGSTKVEYVSIYDKPTIIYWQIQDFPHRKATMLYFAKCSKEKSPQDIQKKWSLDVALNLPMTKNPKISDIRSSLVLCAEMELLRFYFFVILC